MIKEDPLLPTGMTSRWDIDLRRRLTELLREIIRAINALSAGQAGGSAALPTMPTSGSYAIGDVVRKSNPTELGTPGAKYVLYGWCCVGTSPLAFVEMRNLTGN